MDVTIKNDIESGTIVEIHCREVTDEIERLGRYISRFDERIMGMADGHAHNVSVSEILNIESVDKRLFCIRRAACFQRTRDFTSLKRCSMRRPSSGAPNQLS